MSDSNKLHFKTNIQLKSIIGKDLINDDNIAILELVKNSFDADAKKVEVQYLNLKGNDDNAVVEFSDKTSRLIIKDNGLGMDLNDIQNKWLNIAYSEKKSNNRQHNRMMAGAKGVGRFSCDRLGEYLNLYTKKRNSDDYLLLKIDWKKFEIDDNTKEIQSIDLDYETLTKTELTNRNIEAFEQGVLLEIIKLRSNWVYETKDARNWNTDKLVNLKKYLEKLINPNQAFEKNDFGIFLNAPEFIEENNKKEEHEKFIGKIENTIFEKLDFKTTSVESEIIDDGKVIFTILKDKGQTIFWIKEKNVFYPKIKDIKVILYYLNTYTKSFFTKQTGVRPVDYGSIYLFMNGFRVTPYGEDGNDWLGLEQRKGQGYARFLGTRDLVGRIEILDNDNDFQIVSSREGVRRDESYKALTDTDGYFFKSFRRLERYIVNGLSWDSSFYDKDDPKLKEIENKIIRGDINEDELIFREDDITKKRRVYESIHSIISAKADNVLELYINEDLILNKIEEEKLNAEREFEQLISDFENKKIDGETLNRILLKKALDNKDLEKQINDLSKYNTNDATTKAIAELQLFKDTIGKQTKIIEDLRNQLEREKLEREKQEKIIEGLKAEKDSAEIKFVEAEKETEKVKAEKKLIEEELVFEQKKGIFKGALIGTDKERIVGLQHQIFHSSSRIERNVKLLVEHLKKSNLDEKTKKHISVISLEASKINSIANFITKANFNLKATEIKTDILNFIKEYLDEIYINESSIIDSKIEEFIIDFSNDINFIIDLKPLEISTLIDNLINNSEKANATKIKIRAFKNDNKLNIEFEDNGVGINSNIIDKAFDFGETTTNGSGIGLFQVSEIVKNLSGEVYIDREFRNGTKIIIQL
ncbi:ATP-binding protein [Flavobacterium sp.]|uniref:ATP-binding protein n=1 Tax=Flavobacterium sp. TaxID=239 RepID=UPI003751D1C3